jgi:hypothetical protein
MRLTVNGLEDCPCSMCKMDNEIGIEEQMEQVAKYHPNALRKVLDEMEAERNDFINSLPPNTKLPDRFI